MVVAGKAVRFAKRQVLRMHRFATNETPAYWRSVNGPGQPGCIVFAQGRTGTWLLHSLLNQHPLLQFDKEILQQPVVAPLHYTQGKAKSAYPHRYGCHIQIDQLQNTQCLDPKAFIHTLADRGWCIVHIRREDIVRQSISAILAVQRGQWVARNTTPADQTPIEIDIERVIARIRRRQSHLALEADILASLPHLSLVYERDLRDAATHASTANKVFDYLNVHSVAVTAETLRMMPEGQERLVKNYEQVMQRVHAIFPDLAERY